jgi:hypothetical protein
MQKPPLIQTTFLRDLTLVVHLLSFFKKIKIWINHDQPTFLVVKPPFFMVKPPIHPFFGPLSLWNVPCLQFPWLADLRVKGQLHGRQYRSWENKSGR